MRAFGRDVASRTIANVCGGVILAGSAALWASIKFVVPSFASRYNLSARESLAWSIVIALSTAVVVLSIYVVALRRRNPPTLTGIRTPNSGEKRQRHIIEFGYVLRGASPLDNGWTKAYGEGEPKFTTDFRMAGSLHIEVTGDKFAMNYRVPQSATLSDCIEFEAEFIRDAFVFADVELVNKDGSQPQNVALAHVIGRGKAPKYEPRYNEWKFYVSPIGRKFTLNLADEVAQVLGAEGPRFCALKTIRLRGGSLLISSITLIRL